MGQQRCATEQSIVGALGQPGDDAVAVLEREFDRYHRGGRIERIVPFVDEAVTLDLDAHPRVRLLVAEALDARDQRDPAVAVHAEAALRTFVGRGDAVGEAHVYAFWGARALQRGELIEAGGWWRRSVDLLPDGNHVQAASLANLSLTTYFETGRLSDSLASAERALALARSGRDRRTEGIAQLYVAFFALNLGDFRRAAATLVAADDIYLTITQTEDRYEWPLVHSAKGVLAALRGAWDAADASFDRALDLCAELDIDWYRGMVLCHRAEFCATVDPHRALADARTALELLADIGDNWWRTWAQRGEVMADIELGALEAAQAALGTLLDQELNPLERGRTLLLAADVRLRHGDQVGAVEALDQAEPLLEVSGSRYWQACALHARARACPGHQARLVRQARRLGDTDPAYRRLGLSEGVLEVKLLGRPGVVVSGQRLHFTSLRSELVVHLLAAAGPVGMHWEKVVDRLWPGVNRKRAKASLRTALWDARRSLGEERVRLERDGELLRLELAGASCDLLDARAVAARGGPVDGAVVAALSRPVLPALCYEDWVVELDREREGLLATLQGR